MPASIPVDASKDEAAPPSNKKGEIDLVAPVVAKDPTDGAKAPARAENAANDVPEERDDADATKTDTKQDKPVVNEDDKVSEEANKNKDAKDQTKKKRGSPTAQPEGHPQPKKFIMEESFTVNTSNNDGYPVIAAGAVDTPLPTEEN